MNNKENKKQEQPKKKQNVFIKKENKEVEELKKKNSEMNEKVLRLSAEIQNMQKRYALDKENMAKYDGMEVIKSMLTIADSLEHAISMDDTNLNDEVSKFLSGFKMIYANMIDSLKGYGVTEIDCLHKPLDVNCMNAVLVDHIQDMDNNEVIDVLQKGYMYKDKVIRPAMVKVNNKESD